MYLSYAIGYTGPPGKKAPARHGRGGAYLEVVNVVRDLVKVF